MVTPKLFWSMKQCKTVQQFSERISGGPSETKQEIKLSCQIQIWDLRELSYASAKESNSKWGNSCLIHNCDAWFKIHAKQIRQIRAMIYLQVATEEEKRDEKVLLGNIYNDKVWNWIFVKSFWLTNTWQLSNRSWEILWISSSGLFLALVQLR